MKVARLITLGLALLGCLVALSAVAQGPRLRIEGARLPPYQTQR